MRQYEFLPVSAIYGTGEYDDPRAPNTGYKVRDRFDRNRSLGYVAKVGKVWKAVRPTNFADLRGFHRSRWNLSGQFGTRHEAAEHLRSLVPNS